MLLTSRFVDKRFFFFLSLLCSYIFASKSAHSSKMKKAVLVEEGLRRMRNCSRGLDGQVVRSVMKRWAMKLRRSGYPQTVRHQVIKESMEKYERMCEVEDSGGRQVHRAREWQKAARRLEKESRKATWHQGAEGQISAPLIIDPTAGGLTSNLKEACSKFEEATGIRVAVKLRAGKSLKSDAKSEPLRKDDCGRDSCLCCSTGHPGGCERNSVGYRITCAGCEEIVRLAQYDGESGTMPSPVASSTRATCAWRWRTAPCGSTASWSTEAPSSPSTWRPSGASTAACRGR